MFFAQVVGFAVSPKIGRGSTFGGVVLLRTRKRRIYFLDPPGGLGTDGKVVRAGDHRRAGVERGAGSASDNRGFTVDLHTFPSGHSLCYLKDGSMGHQSSEGVHRLGTSGVGLSSFYG